MNSFLARVAVTDFLSTKVRFCPRAVWSVPDLERDTVLGAATVSDTILQFLYSFTAVY